MAVAAKRAAHRRQAVISAVSAASAPAVAGSPAPRSGAWRLSSGEDNGGKGFSGAAPGRSRPGARETLSHSGRALYTPLPRAIPAGGEKRR